MTRSIAYRRRGRESPRPGLQKLHAAGHGLRAARLGRVDPPVAEPIGRLSRRPRRRAGSRRRHRGSGGRDRRRRSRSQAAPEAEGMASGPAAAPTRKLSCGESGLCMRMFSPIAALFEGETELLAEGSLQERPVGMIPPPLADLGAWCETASGLPPVRVRGPLRGGKATVDGRASSQLLTGLLIALPLARGRFGAFGRGPREPRLRGSHAGHDARLRSKGGAGLGLHPLPRAFRPTLPGRRFPGGGRLERSRLPPGRRSDRGEDRPSPRRGPRRFFLPARPGHPGCAPPRRSEGRGRKRLREPAAR